jgi:magnesium chelatase subunit I
MEANTSLPEFPFSALVGQPQLQQALLLAAIDPAIGGVLISGPRGTAKSTAARALAPLLPPAAGQAAVPFVTLPLAATLEQLVGTLDVDEALRGQGLRFKPGLLARADSGVLYVDEVNLLPDALVDALLDAAASGVHTVERDGISQRHASRFVLVGTMNPEEGELRAQLLDRFGLSVALANPADAALRKAMVQARLRFDANPQGVLAEHAAAQQQLAAEVQTARGRLAALPWPDAVLDRATALAAASAADGLRADLVMLRAARALAALAGRDGVGVDDVDAVAELALAHRRRVGAEHAGSSPPPAGSQTPASGPADRPATTALDRWPAGPSRLTPPTPTQPAAPASSDAVEPGESAHGDHWGALPPQAAGTLRPAHAAMADPRPKA